MRCPNWLKWLGGAAATLLTFGLISYFRTEGKLRESRAKTKEKVDDAKAKKKEAVGKARSGDTARDILERKRMRGS